VKAVRKFNVTVNGKCYEVEVEEVKGAPSVNIPVNQEPVKEKSTFESVKSVQPVKVEQKPQKTEQIISRSDKSDGNGLAVTAPMPGTVLEVKVNAEDKVSKGQVLVVLEAMKMENEIVAPKDGRIGVLKAVKGSTVKAGDVLLTVI
jgi:biotin carboxyl carrier protein